MTKWINSFEFCTLEIKIINSKNDQVVSYSSNKKIFRKLSFILWNNKNILFFVNLNYEIDVMCIAK